jgi:hypothetical protein
MKDETNKPETVKKESVKSYKDKNVWMRGLYMVIFMILLGVAKFVSFIVILMQFLTVLFTAETNDKLVKFGKSLSLYQYEIMLFLTYNCEVHPYPIGEWPEVTEIQAVTETPDAVEAEQTTEVADKN